MFLLFTDSTALRNEIGYKIGYYAGAWLPFIIMVIIATLIIYKKKRG